MTSKFIQDILTEMEDEINKVPMFGQEDEQDEDQEEVDEAEENIDKKLASTGRGEQAKQQLDSVWNQLLRSKDLNTIDDAELGKLLKQKLDKSKQTALINALSKGIELEPIETNTGNFMRQKQTRRLYNSKEYKNLDVMREGFIHDLRLLLENEVEQAEVLMASKGFSEELQVMIEKLGRLMNEKLPPVIDQMRLAYGTDQADVFGETMRSDMQSILDTLLAVRENIDHAVVSISQGKMPHDESDMDADGNLTDTGGAETGMDLDMEPSSDLQNELGDLSDEFGGDDSMSGPIEDPLGRAKKESIKNLKNQLHEMRKQIAKVKKSK